MSRSDRAKQFLPFNALRGYYDLIKEKEVIKEEKRILSDEEKEVLSKKLFLLKKGMMVKIKYYSSYSYITIEGLVSSIDEINHQITIVRNKINFDDISDIDCEEIKEYFIEE